MSRDNVPTSHDTFYYGIYLDTYVRWQYSCFQFDSDYDEQYFDFPTPFLSPLTISAPLPRRRSGLGLGRGPSAAAPPSPLPAATAARRAPRGRAGRRRRRTAAPSAPAAAPASSTVPGTRAGPEKRKEWWQGLQVPHIQRCVPLDQCI